MTFLEPFDDPDILLGRFSRNDFRGQWDPAGQDSNRGHGTDLPDNVRITNGQLVVESGMQNYGETIVRSNTPWAGTGTIEFDVVGDALSPEAQVVVLILDRPYPWTGFEGENANTPHPQYGVGYYAKNPQGRAWSNYVQTDYYQRGTPDIPNGSYKPGVLQHWIITIGGGNMWLTIDGADTDIGLGSPRKIPLPAGFNPVGSWISLGTHNHASIKYTPYLETCTTRFDNLTYASLPTGRAARVPISGPQQFGWHLVDHATETPIVHETTDLALGTGATAAWLLFNAGSYTDDGTTSTRLWYSLNGNTAHQVPMQITGMAVHQVGTFSVPVALAELRHGINTVTISQTAFGTFAPQNSRYANVELVVLGGAGEVLVNKLKVGASTVAMVKLGSTTVGRMLLGATEVWAGAAPIPTGLTATSASTAVALSWTATSSAVRYVTEFRLHKSLATQYADRFDNRIETLRTPWVVRTGSTWTIVSDTGGDAGHVRADTASTDSLITPGNLLTVDGYVMLDFQMAAGAALIGLSMRGTSTTATQNELVVEVSPAGAYSLVEIVGGTRTVLASTANVYTPNTRATMRLEAVGNQAGVYINDVLTLTGTITTLLTGTTCSMRMNRTGTADIYEYRMGNYSIGGWRQWSTPVVTNTAVTGLVNGQQYDFRVAAYNIYGRGGYTPVVSSIPAVAPPTVPGSPTLATATPRDTQVVLGWTAPASNGGDPITQYRIDKRIGAAAFAQHALTGTPVQTYTVTGLVNGTAYDFRVSAQNSVGFGAVSNTVAATPVAPVAPGVPTLSTAIGGDTTVTLTWTAPSSDGGAPITDYLVQKSANGTTGWTSAESTTSAALTQVITGLTNATIQYFRVSATNSAGTGAPSNVLSATPTSLVLFTDDFNRANGALTAPWVNIEGVHSIVSNKLPGGPLDPTISYYNQTFSADHWAEGDIVTIGSGVIGPAIRINGSDFYYLWVAGASPPYNITIYKRIGGTYSQVGSTSSGTPGTTYTGRLEAQGTTLRAYANGVLMVTATDSSLATGRPGILSVSGTATLDNFRCGNMPYVP